jgi:hypothetical protein
MTCGCSNIPVMNIKHSDLDSGLYIRTKAETPDPAITTSATAYARFQRELRQYLKLILTDATEIDLERYPNAQTAYAEMERLVLQHQRAIPAFVQQFLIRQATAGMAIGMSRIPEGRRVQVFPEVIDRQIEEATVRLQRQAKQSLRTSLRSLMGDGLERGETIRELSGRVQDWAKQNGDIDRQVKWRATRVARTESSRALNEGQVEAWKEAGLTRMKWQIAPNPCDFCKMMSQKPHPIAKPFFGQGEVLQTDTGKRLTFDYSAIKSPPLHPNCRCTLLPIISNK